MPELVLQVKFEADEASLNTIKDRLDDLHGSGGKGGDGGATDPFKGASDGAEKLNTKLRRLIQLNEIRFRQDKTGQAQALKNAQRIEEAARNMGLLNDETLKGVQLQKTLHLSQQRIETGFKGMATTSATANRSLVNLGRIVQDLPFGFLGISNNIDPALNSFRQLRQETGSTRLALKSLLGAMAGSGGLIFALGSLLPTAVLVAQQGFNMYAKSANKAKSETDGLSSSVVRFINELTKLENTNDSVEVNYRKVLTVFNEINRTLEIQSDLASQLTRDFTDLSARQQFNLSIQKEVVDEAIEGYGKLKDLTEEQRESLQARLDNLVKEQEERELIREILAASINPSEVLLGIEKARLSVVSDIKDEYKFLADEYQRLGLDKVSDPLQQSLDSLMDLDINFEKYKDPLKDLFSFEDGLGSDITFGDEDIFDEFAKQYEQTQKDLTARRLLEINKEQKAFEDAMKQQLETAQFVSSQRVMLEQNTVSALRSISQGFAEENKGLAMAILAIEKGLAIAQVVVEGIKQAQKAKAAAAAYSALAAFNPAYAAAAVNANIQAGRIAALTAGNVAAITAQGIGEAININNRGSRSEVNTGGAGSVSGFSEYNSINSEPRRPNASQPIYLSLEGDLDPTIMAVKVKQGQRRLDKSTKFVTDG